MCQHFLFSGIIFRCMYIPHVTYPLLHWWMLALLLHLSCGVQCCCEHGCVNIFSRSSFPFFWMYTQKSWLARTYFNFLRIHHSVFYSRCFIYIATVYRRSSLFSFWSALISGCFLFACLCFWCSHLNKYRVAYPSFDLFLLFANKHLFFFEEMLIQVLRPFLSGLVFCCWVLEFPMYLDINPYSYMQPANIFMHCVSCLLILLTVSLIHRNSKCSWSLSPLNSVNSAHSVNLELPLCGDRMPS